MAKKQASLPDCSSVADAAALLILRRNEFWQGIDLNARGEVSWGDRADLDDDVWDWPDEAPKEQEEAIRRWEKKWEDWQKPYKLAMEYLKLAAEGGTSGDDNEDEDQKDQKYANEIRLQIFAQCDKFHFRGDNSLFCIMHLGDGVAAG